MIHQVQVVDIYLSVGMMAVASILGCLAQLLLNPNLQHFNQSANYLVDNFFIFPLLDFDELFEHLRALKKRKNFFFP